MEKGVWAVRERNLFRIHGREVTHTHTHGLAGWHRNDGAFQTSSTSCWKRKRETLSGVLAGAMNKREGGEQH